LPEGESGEVVFTTLTRRGMPLIRYRTGDLARFIGEPCPCGTVLRRLGHIRGRLGSMVTIGDGFLPDISDLSEALYPIPGLIDYRAEVHHEDGRDVLAVTVRLCDTDEKVALERVIRALLEIPEIGGPVAAGGLALSAVASSLGKPFSADASKKRILDLREKGSGK